MVRSTKTYRDPSDHIRELVKTVVESYLAQLEATDYRVGNKHARRGGKAFEDLCKYGNSGRDALAVHLKDKRPEVRLITAVWLLGYRHRECMEVLQQLAQGKGMTSFCARQTMKNWETGDWQLDAEYPSPNGKPSL